MKKGITIAVIFTMIWLCIFACHAIGETTWDCTNPDCGRKGNTGNFCGSCGSPAPWMTESSGTETTDTDGTIQDAVAESSKKAAENIKPNEYYPNGNPKREYIYNDEGNLSRTNYYNRYGCITSYEISLEWDQSGNVLKNEEHYPNNTGKYAVYYNTMAYDANGNCIRSSYTYADGSPGESYSETQYDNEGRRIARTDYNADGSIEGYAVDYLYDQDKHLLGYTSLDANRNVQEVYSAVWSNGIRIESTDTDPQGTVTAHRVYDPEYGDILSSYYKGDEGSEYTDEYVYYDDYYEDTWCILSDGSRSITRYNPDGTITRSEWSKQNKATGEWVFESSTEYSVNAAGNTVENRINQDGSKNYIERDGNGNAILNKSYAADGTFEYFYANEYDSLGQQTKSARLNASGTVESYTIYEYDSNGNRIKTAYYNADGSFDFGYSCEYDANGNEIRQNSLDENGQIKSYYLKTYNSDGLCTREEYYSADGQLNNYELYEYDENRYYSHTVTYRADGTKSWETYYRVLDDGTRQRKSYSYNTDGSINKEYDWE